MLNQHSAQIENDRNQMKNIIPFLLFIFSMQSCNWNNNGQEGYKGDLIPIKEEVKNLQKYEQAVKLLLKYNEKLDDERKAKSKLFKETGREGKFYLQDSLYKVLQDRGLRFPRYEIKIEEKDTIIIFNPEAGDYYMRGNNKDKDACCTLFEHDIVYSTKQIEESEVKDNEDDTPSTVIKLKDRMYYRIYSRLEY
jgi:hypothetical protein